MRKWKMVPVEPTDEMFMAGRRVSGDLDTWDAYLAAAPKWEPSDADVERGVVAYRAELTRIFDAADRLEAGDCYNAMRAAIKAAIGGHDE